MNQIGGFAGTSWNNSLISKSYSEGTVEGQYIVGGFSGFVTFAFGPPTLNRIEDSYSRSNVMASIETVGGFYGFAQSAGNFKNVYSTGTVSLVNETGGFLGKVANLTIVNAHFDSTNAPFEAIGAFAGAPATLDITGHSTSDMKTEAFKNTMNAGSSTGVWSINPAINDGFPYLNTQPLLAANEVKNTNVDIQVTPTNVDAALKIISPENNISYQIIEMTGKTVKKGTQKEVNVSTLSKGIYIINVKTEKGSKSIKFIKK